MALGESGTGDEQWQHLQLAFLKPENIKDKDGNKPDSPDYNPRTLFVPKTFMDDCTPVSSLYLAKSFHHSSVCLLVLVIIVIMI